MKMRTGLKWIVAALLIVGQWQCAPRSAAADFEAASGGSSAAPLTLPLLPESVRFAVIGDAGTGSDEQYELAARMTRYHREFPFEFVLMLGDNLYGREEPEDYEEKFERPYRPLLNRGVTFYASLGNHDEPEQRFYRLFNMNGERFYSFKKGDVAFFALDSNYMDPDQLDWLKGSLDQSDARWKICFFHHPIYSSGGRHGPDLELREHVEPIFTEKGVDVVFAGHEHFYERIRPQNGVLYFTSGAAAKLRRGNVQVSRITAQAFDQDRSFILVEIAGDTLYFQTISRRGRSVDSGRVTLGEF